MFKRLLKHLFMPVVREFPFFSFFYFLLLPNLFTQYLKNDLQLHRFLEPFSCNGVDNSTALLFAYIAALLVYYSRSKIVKWTLLLIALIGAVIRVFLYISYKMWINDSALALLKETNNKEASEFLSSYVMSTNGLVALLFALVIIVLFFFADRFRGKIASWLERSRVHYALCFIVGCFLVLALYNLRFYTDIYFSKTKEEAGNHLDRYGFPYTTRGHNTILDLFVGYKTLELSTKEAVLVGEYAIRYGKEEPATTPEDSITVVYVLGESYIRRHAHLYGYELETTPCLDKEKASGNLFVFNDVVAPFNLTYKVEANTFFCNSIADGEPWYSSPFFMQLFKQAGFFVAFFDNQHTGSGFTLENLKGSRVYNREIVKRSYSMVSDHNCDYDGDFIKYVQSIDIPDSARSMHVYHLMGQHGPAYQRYPAEFGKFTAKDIKRKETYVDGGVKAEIAKYDNATLYNDQVMGSIINMYKDKNAVLVYMSDHGEEMYDYRNSAGRAKAGKGQEALMARHQFLIPFMIWCSDKYIARHPDKIAQIKSSLDRPFMTDNLAQVLFSLSSLQTKYYKPDRDLISPQFKKRKRIINDSGSMVCDYNELKE